MWNIKLSVVEMEGNQMEGRCLFSRIQLSLEIQGKLNVDCCMKDWTEVGGNGMGF